MWPQSDMFFWLMGVLADEFSAISLPRVVVIKNRRLAIFYKVMQVLCVILSLVFFIYSEFFFKPQPVRPWGISMWHEEGLRGSSKIFPAYCENPSAYVHRQGAMFSYEPTECRAMPSQEAMATTDNHNGLFLATFVDEVMVWEGMGKECGAAARQACINRTGNAIPVYEEVVGNDRCSCSLHSQFLVQNPEEQRIRLAYGFEVDLSHGERTDLRRGGILSSAHSIGPQHKLKEQPSDEETIFLAPNGEACEFGGKSTWKSSDSNGGISGTLGELLNCAGVTLDSDPATLVSGTLLAPPHLRTMGFRIDLHLDIKQPFFSNTLVHVRAVAVPVAAVMRSSNVKLSTFPTSNGGAASSNVRRVHGVSVSMPVMTGYILKFNWLYFLAGLVDVAVIMTIPSALIYFVALYLLGISSEVYRGVVRTKFSIFNKAHGAVAQLMLAEVAFRGLLGNWHSRLTELDGLTPQMLSSRLCDLFHEHRVRGVLQETEIEQMANVVFMAMDKNQSGSIQCGEFIQASTEDAEINMQRLATYFGTREAGGRVSGLRHLVDDTYYEKETAHENARNFVKSVPVFDLDDMNENITVESSTPGKLSALPACDLGGVSLAKVEQRMHDLERQCEQALASLRQLVTQSPQSQTSPDHPMLQSSFKSGQGACPVLSRLTPSNRCIDASGGHGVDHAAIHTLALADSELELKVDGSPFVPAACPNPSIAGKSA